MRWFAAKLPVGSSASSSPGSISARARSLRAGSHRPRVVDVMVRALREADVGGLHGALAIARWAHAPAYGTTCSERSQRRRSLKNGRPSRSPASKLVARS